jgi:hypothetical protein
MEITLPHVVCNLRRIWLVIFYIANHIYLYVAVHISLS